MFLLWVKVTPLTKGVALALVSDKGKPIGPVATIEVPVLAILVSTESSVGFLVTLTSLAILTKSA